MPHPKLHPPLLELSFYSADRHEADLFRDVVLAACSIGRCGGSVTYVHEPGARSNFLPGVPGSDRGGETNVFATGDLAALLDDPDVRVLAVSIQNLVPTLGRSAGSTIEYAFISDEAARRDWHPVELCASGEQFALWWNSGDRRDKKRADAAWKSILKRFKKLVEAVEPSYATVTVEYALECLLDLRRDPRSYAFVDFYVDAAFVGTSRVERIKKICAGYNVEQVARGLLLSPARPSDNVSRNSAAVAEVVAEVNPAR